VVFAETKTNSEENLKKHSGFIHAYVTKEKKIGNVMIVQGRWRQAEKARLIIEIEKKNISVCEYLIVMFKMLNQALYL